MTTPTTSSPAPTPDNVRQGLIHTQISRPVAIVMTWLFLAILFSVPLLQSIIEFRRRDHQSILAITELFRSQIPTGKDFSDFELSLSDSSDLRRLVQPRLQLQLSSSAGFGTDQVTLGRDNWLFYQPGIDFVSGRGILDPHRMKIARQKAADAGDPHYNPDPRPAILQLQRDCSAAGIRLILVPIPDKAGVQPAELTRRLANYSGPALANRDFDALLSQLRAQGVDILDSRPTLSPSDIRFLRQDTHWTPAFMEEVAKSLAEHIPDPAGKNRRFSRTEVSISRLGDLVDMLRLPKDQALFGPQTVTLHEVRDAMGRLWKPAKDAPLLLLGDSFANIYTIPTMGWGQSAGLGAQLSFELGRDVDVLATNGSGASILRELARRDQPFAGKSVIIWEFTARDLTHEDWPIVPLSSGPATATAFAYEGPLIIQGTITDLAPLDIERKYPNALRTTRVKVSKFETGQLAAEALYVQLLVMENFQLTTAAALRPGQTVRLTLRPRSSADSTASLKDLDSIERLPVFVAEKAELLP